METQQVKVVCDRSLGGLVLTVTSDNARRLNSMNSVLMVQEFAHYITRPLARIAREAASPIKSVNESKKAQAMPAGS